MKNLLVIAALLITVSCKKQASEKLAPETPREGKTISDKQANELMAKEFAGYNRHGSGINAPTGRTNNNFYHTCAYYYTGGQPYWSEGLAFETTVEKLQIGNARIKSNWCAFQYSYYVNGQKQTDWVQWGYAVHKMFGLIQGFFVYHIRGPLGYGIKSPLNIIYSDQEVPLQYGAKVRFEIVNVPGTTFWRFLRNGQAVMDVDLEVSSAQGEFEVCTESWGNASFNTQVTVDYMETLTGGAWVKIPQARSELRPWTVQGTMQIPSFPSSKFIMGGREVATTYPYPWLLWGY